MKLGFLFFLLIASSLAFGEIYKWTDESGRVHFSDKAPKGKAETIEFKKHTPSQSTFSEQRSKESVQRFLQALEEEKAITLEKENEKAKQRAKMELYCQRLEKEINIYNQGYAIVRYGQDGSHEYLTDQEIDANKQRFRKSWSDNCEGL